MKKIKNSTISCCLMVLGVSNGFAVQTCEKAQDLGYRYIHKTANIPSIQIRNFAPNYGRADILSEIAYDYSSAIKLNITTSNATTPFQAPLSGNIIFTEVNWGINANLTGYFQGFTANAQPCYTIGPAPTYVRTRTGYCTFSNGVDYGQIILNITSSSVPIANYTKDFKKRILAHEFGHIFGMSHFGCKVPVSSTYPDGNSSVQKSGPPIGVMTPAGQCLDPPGYIQSLTDYDKCVLQKWYP